MVEIWGMSATTLDVSLLGSILAGRGVLRAGERQIEPNMIFNAASSFNQFWNLKILLEGT